jgi:hypothetical protein
MLLITEAKFALEPACQALWNAVIIAGVMPTDSPSVTSFA